MKRLLNSGFKGFFLLAEGSRSIYKGEIINDVGIIITGHTVVYSWNPPIGSFGVGIKKVQ